MTSPSSSLSTGLCEWSSPLPTPTPWAAGIWGWPGDFCGLAQWGCLMHRYWPGCMICGVQFSKLEMCGPLFKYYKEFQEAESRALN